VISRDFYRTIKSNTEFRFLPDSKLSGLFTAGYVRRSVKKIRNKIIDGIGVLKFVYFRDPEGNIIEIQSWEK
jgi:catechol 2,3-dioxygenase-like lactoylglutathione lyase family enzyme